MVGDDLHVAYVLKMLELNVVGLVFERIVVMFVRFQGCFLYFSNVRRNSTRLDEILKRRMVLWIVHNLDRCLKCVIECWKECVFMSIL